MARYRGPKERLSRREGIDLFDKGPKCALNRRPYPPGMTNWRRPRFSEYRNQMREKQKVKRYYGVLERQFKVYFRRAQLWKGNTGLALLMILERRLDNVIFRLGFAKSRPQARQLVTHGHIAVNGRKVDRPSFQVRTNDKIIVRDRPKSRELVKLTYELTEGRDAPKWLSVDKPNFSATVVALPERVDIEFPIQEQLIVEHLSR